MESSFVDVAIGLVLMYLVLSLICTTINELISTGLKWRSQTLAKAIKQLIDNDELRKAFYNDGLITNAAVASTGQKPPDAAPSDATQPQSSSDKTPAKPNGPPTDRNHPSYLDGGTFAMALLDSLTSTHQGKAITGKATGITEKFPTIDEIEKIAGDLPDSNIRDVLLASIVSGKKDIAHLRDNLAAWFDSAMDRLSGEYKRDLKKWSLIVGIGIALVFNADSIHVSRALWSDSTLRSNIVSAASQIVEKGAPSEQKCKEGDLQTQAACLFAQLKTDQEGVRPFPIGWPDEAFTQGLARALPKVFRPPPSSQPSGTTPAKPPPTHPIDFIWILLMKLLGLAWTGIAVSLGAPFWFDALAKFMNIRGSGPKPKEAAPNTQKAVAKAREAAAKAQEAAAIAQAAAPKAQAASTP